MLEKIKKIEKYVLYLKQTCLVIFSKKGEKEEKKLFTKKNVRKTLINARNYADRTPLKSNLEGSKNIIKKYNLKLYSV